MGHSKMLIICGVLVFAGAALGQEPNYVQIGQAAVSGFRCATLAAHARLGSEETRLLAYGLTKAQIFVQAARDKKVSMEDFSRSEFVLPIVLRAWSFNHLNVSIDFSAGQIYEAIWEQTTDELGEKTHKIKPPQTDYREWAHAEYRKQNCELLGK